VGQPDHLSVHPGGLVITPGPLTDHVPVQLAPKGFLITQFDHGDVEAIGLPKIDLLGIRALTVLADAAELVRSFDDPAFDVDAIPLDDPATGDQLMAGETIGVFQCESTGAQRTLRQLKARTVRDLAVANAFFKPGPATGGMAVRFVRRYRGEEAVRYLHPTLEPILRATRGVLLFQEQVLRVAREIAGLSWEEADRLRKGMSKFDAGEMTALAQRFQEGCRRTAPDGPGFDPAQARQLWEQVAAFAGYGFNQGHATAYADVSYR
jgi:DNA polymerase III alpha subunit